MTSTLIRGSDFELDNFLNDSITSDITAVPQNQYRKPYAVVSSITSMAQTSATSIRSHKQSYYNTIIPFGKRDLPTSYEIRTIEDALSENDCSDEIAIYKFADKSSVRKNRVVLPFSPLKKADTNYDEPESIWRGIFPLSSKRKVTSFKKTINNVNELPAWRPHLVIDINRLEHDDE